MKKLLLATVVLATMSAHAAPELYGRAVVTLDIRDVNADNVTRDVSDAGVLGNERAERDTPDDRSQLTSTGSRIGLKGSEQIAPNMRAMYQLEYGVNVDNSKGNFKPRNTFVGIKHDTLGTIKAGRLTAVDDEINYADVTNGGVLGGAGVLAGYDGNRTNNVIAYTTPSTKGGALENTTVHAMYVLNEKSQLDGGFDRDAYGVAVDHTFSDQLAAGASVVKSGDFQSVRVSGAYNVTPAIKVGALYQSTKYIALPGSQAFTGSDERAIAVSAKMKTNTPWTPYAQVDLVENANGYNGKKRQRVVLGSTYKFNDRTTGHVYGASLKDDVNSIDFVAAEKVGDKRKDGTVITATDAKRGAYTAARKAEGFGIGAGIQYNF